jgi:mercuric ion transport protein
VRRTVLAGSAGVVAALGASLCCLGPILFVTLGVGAGWASTFEPLRPVFTALTVLGLGIGFYTVYARPEKAEGCAPGEACARPTRRGRDKLVLWSATGLAVLFWSFNYWSILLV